MREDAERAMYTISSPSSIAERAGLVQLFAEPIEDRLRQHRERRRRQIGMAERQHARPQVEPPRVVGRDEAELRQRVQAAPRRRARNARPMADLRDRHPALLVREGQHHGQSPCQRGDEIGVVAELRDGLGDELRRIGRPRRRRQIGDLDEWFHRLKDIGFARHGVLSITPRNRAPRDGCLSVRRGDSRPDAISCARFFLSRQIRIYSRTNGRQAHTMSIYALDGRIGPAVSFVRIQRM